MGNHRRHDGLYTSASTADVTTSSMRQLLKAIGPVVYVVEIDGLIKIGHTTDLSNRMYQYGAGTTLLAWLTGRTRADEAEIHASLRDHLAKGREWYHPTPEVMAFVRSARDACGMSKYAA